MRKQAIFISIAFIAAVCSCGGTKRGSETVQRPAFRTVEIPAVYNDMQSRAEYLSKHYWDNVDFADTAWIGNAVELEKALPDYLEVLQIIPKQAVGSSLRILLDRASADSGMFAVVTDMLEKYLYDPNSPMRDEENYIPVLEYIIASDKVDSLEKIRPAYQLGMAMKNRPGTPAADFEYTLPDGSQRRLYGIKAPYTLIYFYNPECSSCEEIRREIAGTQFIKPMSERGELTILAVYTDEDESIWRKHFDEIPEWWINARDRECAIKNERIYDLRAIPSMYLLDADKNVILKDAYVQMIERYFASRQ